MNDLLNKVITVSAKEEKLAGGKPVMKIFMSNGNFVLVDSEDYEQLNKFVWHRDRNGYAKRNIPRLPGKNQTAEWMHKVVMNTPKDKSCDHINGNPSDNRKINLRICTHAQNMMNTKIRKDNSTGFKGITKYGNQWLVQIQSNKIKYYIGLFENKLHAALAYDLWARELHGKFAKTNFKTI